MVQKKRLKRGNNPSSVCLHWARCWLPTLWRQYGISESHKCTGLPLSHQPGAAYFTGKQMLRSKHYPHGTDAVPCTQGSVDDDYRTTLWHELFKGITYREVIQSLLSTFGLKRRLRIYAAKKTIKNILKERKEIKIN